MQRAEVHWTKKQRLGTRISPDLDWKQRKQATTITSRDSSQSTTAMASTTRLPGAIHFSIYRSSSSPAIRRRVWFPTTRRLASPAIISNSVLPSPAILSPTSGQQVRYASHAQQGTANSAKDGPGKRLGAKKIQGMSVCIECCNSLFGWSGHQSIPSYHQSLLCHTPVQQETKSA